jgi:hypothetical protein
MDPIDNFFKDGNYQKSIILDSNDSYKVEYPKNGVNNNLNSNLCVSEPITNHTVLDYNGLKFELNDLVENNINELYYNDNIKNSIKRSPSIVNFDDGDIGKSFSDAVDDYINITEHTDLSEASNDLVELIQRYNKNDLNELRTIIDRLVLDDKLPNVGPVSTLDYLIEGASVNKTKQSIVDTFINLNEIIFRWRKIAGDGNCFYRAVMFSYIENIILSKDLELLAYVILDLNDLFSDKTITNNIHCKTSQVVLSKVDFVTKIFILIYFSLQLNTAENIQKGYEIFIKSINLCRNFDLALILYFRLKMYNFVKNNSNKLYSKDFSVKVGNLLPAQYETEKGEFLFEKFYEEYLLKMYQDAEKIVIYLTPFVLKVNLDIIIYDFVNKSTENLKELACGLKDTSCINILYKKDHYDLIYTKEHFERFARYLSLYVNLEEKLKIINDDVYKEIAHKVDKSKDRASVKPEIRENAKMNNENINFNNKSQAADDDNIISIFNKVNSNINNTNYTETYKDKPINNYGDINSFLLSTNKCDIIDDVENINKITNNTNTVNNSNPIFQSINNICLLCQQSNYLPPELPLYCLECLDNETYSYFFTKYLNFIDISKVTKKTKPNTNLKDVFHQSKFLLKLVFFNLYIKIREDHVPSHIITGILNKDITTILKDIKSKLCIMCDKNLKPSEAKLITQCGCLLCEKCDTKYINFLVSTKKKNESKILLNLDLNCICTADYNIQGLQNLFTYCHRQNLNQCMEGLLPIISYEFNKNCMLCLRDLTKGARLVAELSDPEAQEFTDTFTHSICLECYIPKELVKLHCNICDREHYLNTSFRKGSDNGCLII